MGHDPSNAAVPRQAICAELATVLSMPQVAEAPQSDEQSRVLASLIAAVVREEHSWHARERRELIERARQTS